MTNTPKVYNPLTGLNEDIDPDALIPKRLPSGAAGNNMLNVQAGTGLLGQAINHQMIVAPNGQYYRVEELLQKAEEAEKWKVIKGILEAHEIIEDWPDGDIIIRIKRKRVESGYAAGEKPVPSDYRVDFGVDDEEE